ncbi:MAG: hypothetical protein Q9163_004890, partial [Psora crenata]
MGIAASREFATEIANCADRGIGLESVLENPKITNGNVFLVTRALTTIFYRGGRSPINDCLLNYVAASEKSRRPRRRIVCREYDKFRSQKGGAKIEQVLFDSPFVDDPLEDISKWTRVFLKFGERIKTIARGNRRLGALIVIPLSLLSMRQWAKRLTEAEIGHAIQHSQSIEVGKVAKKAKAHTVANRIHDLILQSFINGVVKVPDPDQDEQMVDEDDEDDGEEIFEAEDDGSSINNRSTSSNATSVSTSLNTSDQGFYPHQDVSRLEYLSQAADLATQQNARQFNGFNLMPAPDNFQSPPATLPTNYMELEPLRNFDTGKSSLRLRNCCPSYLNYKGSDQSVLDSAQTPNYPEGTPANPAGYNVSEFSTYPNLASANPAEYDVSTFSTYPNGAGYNLSTFSTYPNGTL